MVVQQKVSYCHSAEKYQPLSTVVVAVAVVVVVVAEMVEQPGRDHWVEPMWSLS